MRTPRQLLRRAPASSRRRRTAMFVVAIAFLLIAPTMAAAASRTGTNGPEKIIGTKGSDVINGLGGDDIIFAGKGEDRVNGGAGNDRLEGEDSRDLLLGAAGNGLLVIDKSGNRDVLIFPDVDFSQARVERKGKNNILLITPGGTVEIADQFEGNPCKETKNRTSEVEGIIFRGGQQADILIRPTIRLVRVDKIDSNDCGGQFCISFGNNVCKDGIFYEKD